MANGKIKLELTWIGKENRPKLEPRILLEDREKSHHAPHRFTEHDIFDNRLIFGDNLLALKALEQEFANQIKCIYIDPPYNTGSAFAEYEDGLEHSLWLSMMSTRIELLHKLLSKSGSLWIQLDDNESHYCKAMLDEIFGRPQFIANVIWNKSYAVRSNADFFSTSHEHLLVYCKDRASFRIKGFSRTAEHEARFKNPDNDPRGPWQSVAFTISLVGGARGRQFAKTGQSENIYEVTSPSGKTFLPPPNRCWARSPGGFESLNRDQRLYWGADGDRAPRLKMFLSESKDEVLPTTLWADGEIFGFNQDGVREVRELDLGETFSTPKPERLIEKVIHVSTDPGDLVLDSFLGSGTTAAVAHKMKRRWIGVEVGRQALTLCAPRLRKVIDGLDEGGITKSQGWTGGGGFRFYTLAPSLLEKDQFGNWIINKKYNGAMLTEAMCKLEGFIYAPSDTYYWQHGHSTESDFIYVTTQTLTRDQIAKLSDEVGSSRSLLVCCSAFRTKKLDEFPNLTVRKIPKAVLSKCEWGHDDYSLEIKNLPVAPAVEQAAAPSVEVAPVVKVLRGSRKVKDEPSLFATEGK